MDAQSTNGIMQPEATSEEPPLKKARIEDDSPQDGQEIAKLNEEQNTEPAGTTSNLPHSRQRLALELECEIFAFLTLPIQRKFIWGLGSEIYDMFGHKILVKTKRLVNPQQNRWDPTGTKIIVSPDGLTAKCATNGWNHVFAMQGFPISGQQYRAANYNFPGTLLYYFEATELPTRWWGFSVGLSSGDIPQDDDFSFVGQYPNSYALEKGREFCHFSGNRQDFEEWQEDAPQAQWSFLGDVVGCGLLLDPNDNLSIFFTLNGVIMGKPMPINPPPNGDHLYPTISSYPYISMMANFGDDLAKPFKFDINKML